MNKALLKKIGLGVFAVLVIAFLIFNEYGILKFLGLKNEVNELDKKIELTNKDLKKTTAENDSLRTNNKKIEKVAREKYNMKRVDEQGLEIKEVESNEK